MNENRSPADSLSPEKMQLFLATRAFAAARDSEGEAALYCNSIAEFRALETTMASFEECRGACRSSCFSGRSSPCKKDD
jgi:hypothetical protein